MLEDEFMSIWIETFRDSKTLQENQITNVSEKSIYNRLSPSICDHNSQINENERKIIDKQASICPYKIFNFY